MAKLFNFFSAPKNRRGNLINCINKYANESRRNRSYKRRYWNLATKLRSYETHRGLELFTDSINYERFEDIVMFFKDKYNYRPSTLNSLKGYLNVIMNYCQRKSYLIDKSFSEFPIRQDDPVSVYLTNEEIQKIHNLKIKGNPSIVRDLFVIGCCTGLRFSDYSKLSGINIIGKTLSINTQKTGVKVVIPIHWMVSEIIDRNNGTIPIHCHSQQNFNKIIKNIAKRAGISSDVTIERIQGNFRVKKRVKKYNLVSSHTARRSFATNMYLAGIAIGKIMLFTGHKTESSFFKYIRINKQENAKELAEHPFFRRKN